MIVNKASLESQHCVVHSQTDLNVAGLSTTESVRINLGLRGLAIVGTVCSWFAFPVSYLFDPALEKLTLQVHWPPNHVPVGSRNQQSLVGTPLSTTVTKP